MLSFLISCVIGAAGAVFIIYSQFSDTLFMGMCRNFIELLFMLRDIKSHQKTVARDPAWHIADFFERSVDKDPDRALFVVAEDSSETTRAQADKLSNQIAAWAKTLNLKQKDTVALMMFNKPEFFSIWLGLSKIGISTGLLNTNITGKPLLHSIELAVKDSGLKVFIVDTELKEGLAAEIAELEASNVRVFSWDEVEVACRNLPTSRPSREDRNLVSNTDTLILIYTSGTTGLPVCKSKFHTKLELYVNCFVLYHRKHPKYQALDFLTVVACSKYFVIFDQGSICTAVCHCITLQLVSLECLVSLNLVLPWFFGKNKQFEHFVLFY
jgi:acyl-CoA synthetase (AMP-forming)/AMP-acid ligase II